MTLMLAALVLSLQVVFSPVQAAPSSGRLLRERPLPSRGPRLISESEKRSVALVAILQSMKRQVQPCVNEQRSPGPGANRISLLINLKLNKDGSLASDPRTVRATGVDDENGRHLQRMQTLATDAFKRCAPYKGLPIDLYSTDWGGWSSFNIKYELPG